MNKKEICNKMSGCLEATNIVNSWGILMNAQDMNLVHCGRKFIGNGIVILTDIN